MNANGVCDTDKRYSVYNVVFCLCAHMSAGDSSPRSHYLERSALFHRITDLNPQSTYTITICAVYGNSEGPEISLSQLTGTGREVSHCVFFLMDYDSSLN